MIVSGLRVREVRCFYDNIVELGYIISTVHYVSNLKWSLVGWVVRLCMDFVTGKHIIHHPFFWLNI